MTSKTTEVDSVKSKIYTIRGVNVMLDRDLSQLYQITTGNLNKAVKRNLNRFPSDFMFQITISELENLRFQFGSANISNKSRSLPHVFTEYGTLMLASILKSDIAISINQMVIRAFIELRKIITSHQEYQILQNTIKRIECRMDTIEANHLVDNTVLGTKINQLSKHNQEIFQNLSKVTETLDKFQNAHIIINRPNEGTNES